MRIKILGCSGGIGAGLHTTSIQVDDDILIDAGTGVGSLRLEEMRGIRNIFVTHSHLDHVTGIPLMIDSVFDHGAEPVTVHGRAETLHALREHIFNWVIWPDFAKLPNKENPVLRYRDMAPGEVFESNGRTIRMAAVNHSIPGAGYRIACATGALAISGDTTTNDTLWEELNRHDRLDVLVVECAFANEDLELSRLAHHYCPQLLAQDLRKLRHRPRVLLTHLKPGEEQRIIEQCRAALPDIALHPLTGGDEFVL